MSHSRILQAGEDGGLELVGGSREERQGLTGGAFGDASNGDANGGDANGRRFDLEDPEEEEDDQELAFATSKFARD